MTNRSLNPDVKLLGPRDASGGYRPVSRQLARLLVMRFDARSLDAARIGRLDHWLHSTGERPQLDRMKIPPTNHPSHGPAQFVHLVLTLAWAIRQWARNPVYEPGRLLFIGQNASSQQHEARVSIPAGYGLADHRLEALYRHAVDIALRWDQPGDSGLTEATAIEHIERILAALRSRPGVVSPTTFQVLKTAHQLDLPFMGLAGGVFQIGWGQRSFRSDRSNSAHDGAIGALISQDKALTAELLTRAGLPAPVHRLVTSADEARAAARAIGFPVVIKPANRDRGEGVTTRIDDADLIDKAFQEARRLSKRVLVEQQIAGVCHRIFVAKGEVLYVVRRDPQSVWGDGRQTVEALIAQTNQRETVRLAWLRDDAYPADALAIQTLAEQGLAMSSIPEAGQRVALRPFETTRWGGVDEDQSRQIHPDNAQAAIEAAKLLGLSNAGVDMITPDISLAWHQSGAVINEVNFSPVLGLAEISHSHLPRFMRRHVQGDGRIPVHAFMGQTQAARRAAQHHQGLCERGITACLIASGPPLIGSTPVMMKPGLGLFERIQACLLRTEVEALTIVVNELSILETGLPVDQLSSVETHVEPVAGAERRWKSLETMLRKMTAVRAVALS